jgi:hypothetical protein
MNQNRKQIINADNISESAYVLPRAEMDRLSHHFGLPATEREKLVQKMKDVLGRLEWSVASGEFAHLETGTRYILDNLGFHYEWGLSDDQLDFLKKYPAATCIVEFKNGQNLEFWIRRLTDGAHYYLMTDYNTGNSHQTPRMKAELEQMVMVDKQSIQIKDILAQNKANIEEEIQVDAPKEPSPPVEPGTHVLDLDL